MNILLISKTPHERSQHTWQYSLDLKKLCNTIEFDILSTDYLLTSYTKDTNIKLHTGLLAYRNLNILHAILSRTHYHAVHIQYEHKMYGSVLHTYLVLLSILPIRLLGHPCIITIHNTPNRNDFVSYAHMWQSNKPKIQHSLLWFIYVNAIRLLVFLSSAIIVHEEFQAMTLKHEYNIPSHTINVIPHHTYSPNPSINPNKNSYHTSQHILFFGFLAPYKGIDTLIHSFVRDCGDTERTLIICGDNPNYHASDLQSKSNNWLIELKKISHPRIQWKQGILYEEIPQLFDDCEYLVLPYKSVFGSSGVLSWALAFQKKIILSSEFAKTNLNKLPIIEHGLGYAISQWEQNAELYYEYIKKELTLREPKNIETKLLQLYEQT